MQRGARSGWTNAMLGAGGLTALLMWSCSGDSPLGPSMSRGSTASSRQAPGTVSASQAAPRSSNGPDAGEASGPADHASGSEPVSLWTLARQGGGAVAGTESSPADEGGGEFAVDRPDESVYAAANNPPVMRLRTSPPYAPGNPYPVVMGPAPLTVRFNLCKSSDPDEGDPEDESDGDSLNWQFHFGDDGSDPFNADGTFNANFARVCRTEHTYGTGTYVATVSVTDKHLEDQSRDVTGLARVTERLTIDVGPSVPASCSNRAVFQDFQGLGAGFLTSPQTVGGLRFTSATDLIVLSGFFTTLPGLAFATNGVGPMTIDLPSARTHFSFPFATASLFMTDTLRVDGYLEGSKVFSRTFSGTPPATGFPEGSASGSGTLFDRLILSSGLGSAVAVDNLSLTCS